jgi:hypothetical protein
VHVRPERPDKPPQQRGDQRSREIAESEEERRDQDGSPRQLPDEVGKLDLQELGRQAFGHQEGKLERLRIAPRLAHAPGRRGRHHLVDLEMARVAKIDQEHGKITGERHHPVTRAEVQGIE